MIRGCSYPWSQIRILIAHHPRIQCSERHRIRIRNTDFLYQNECVGDPDFLKNFFTSTKDIGIRHCLTLLDLLILESRLQILFYWSLWLPVPWALGSCNRILWKPMSTLLSDPEDHDPGIMEPWRLWILNSGIIWSSVMGIMNALVPFFSP